MLKANKNSNGAKLGYYLLRAALNRFQLSPSELSPAQFTEIQRQARTEQAIESRILGSQEARSVVIPPDALHASMTELEGRYENREDFLADLRRNGLDLDLLAEALHCQHRVEAVLASVGARVAPVTKRDAERYYYDHKERFRQPETRVARHILITVNDDFPENHAQAAYLRIGRIRQSVCHEPNRFAQQAKKYSECPSALRGGMLGRVPRGRLYPALDKVLFALGIGEISDIVKSPVGFHILCCEKIHDAKMLSLNQVLPRIIDKLIDRRNRTYIRSWIRSLPR